MSLGQATISTIQHNLKTRYPQSKIDTMSYEDSAGLGTIKKNKKFGGNNTRITVNYGRSQGSADFTEALANITADDDVAFTVTRVKDYQITPGDEAKYIFEGVRHTSHLPITFTKR